MSLKKTLISKLFSKILLRLESIENLNNSYNKNLQNQKDQQ